MVFEIKRGGPHRVAVYCYALGALWKCNKVKFLNIKKPKA